MRKITNQMYSHFYSFHNWKSGNTQLENFRGVSTIRLHGNLIAKLDDKGLHITNAGWSSNTTKERLNALHGVGICQKDFEWYLNGVKWNGEWITIK